ncbi:MAG: MFS transporter, partial [Chloroflexi bacterium]|nr:MFS transporter [Chloroflexota bacterium]
IRDYRLLWLGQFSTSAALWMDTTARGWLIYSLTGSALQLGFIALARGLPLLAFGMIAGVVADRYGQKAQLIISQTTNAILNIILATLILTHHIEVWHIYVTALLTGTVQAFQMPARQTLVNDLAGGEHLMNAISLNSAAFNVSKMVGPAACGILIATLGVDVSYYVQAALFILATIWTIQIRIPDSASRKKYLTTITREPFFISMKEGFTYVFRHRLILALMVLGLAPVFLGLPFSSQFPTYADTVLHQHNEIKIALVQSRLLTMVGVGAIIGVLTIASLGRRQANGKLLILGAAGFGIFLMFFAQSTVLWTAMLFTFLIGLANSGYTSQDQTIIQTLAPSEKRGRVLGIYNLNLGLMPLGSLLLGVLVHYFGVSIAITIVGAACLLIAISVGIFTPRLWKLNLEKEKTMAIDSELKFNKENKSA